MDNEGMERVCRKHLHCSHLGISTSSHHHHQHHHFYYYYLLGKYLHLPACGQYNIFTISQSQLATSSPASAITCISTTCPRSTIPLPFQVARPVVPCTAWQRMDLSVTQLHDGSSTCLCEAVFSHSCQARITKQEACPSPNPVLASCCCAAAIPTSRFNKCPQYSQVLTVCSVPLSM